MKEGITKRGTESNGAKFLLKHGTKDATTANQGSNPIREGSNPIREESNPIREGSNPIRDQRREQPPQRREQSYQMRVVRESQSPRQGYEARREPVRESIGRGYGATDRNYCPNCNGEIYTDPDNCVLCGWSRTITEGRARQQYEGRRTYPEDPAQGHRQDRRTGNLPNDWEKRVEDKIRVRRPPQREDRSWYRPEPRAQEPKKATMDRFKCENCGNPTLQFFADGLGRCSGCGHRFRYSSKSTAFRSKHKQFVCSKCDSKNLQFFSDGRGLCPHCRHEFRWRK